MSVLDQTFMYLKLSPFVAEFIIAALLVLRFKYYKKPTGEQWGYFIGSGAVSAVVWALFLRGIGRLFTSAVVSACVRAVLSAAAGVLTAMLIHYLAENRREIKAALTGFFKEYKYSFIASLASGFASYAFFLFNFLPNHDGVTYVSGMGETITSGRWGIELFYYLFPGCFLPWLNGLITIALFSVIAMLLCRQLGISSRPLQAVTGGLLTAFPSVAGLMTYLFTAPIFAFSALLAVIAVYFAAKEERPVFNSFLALIIMILSLSIYQSYINVFASFLVVLLMRRLLTGEKTAAEVFKTGLRFALIIALSMGIYFGLTKLILIANHTAFNVYSSEALESVSPGGRLYKALRVTAGYLVGSHGLVTSGISTALHCVIVIYTAAVILARFRKEKDTKALLLFILLSGALVVSINTVYLVSVGVHTLVQLGFVSVYYLFALAVQLEQREGSFFGSVKPFVSALLIGVIVCNVVMANRAGLLMKMNYESSYALYSSLLNRVESREDYTPGTKLAVIGKDVAAPAYAEDFADVRIKGSNDLSKHFYSLEDFLRTFLNYRGEFASEEEMEEIEKTEAFKQMPVYPYAGSIERMGDLIVVKLSN